MRLRIRGVSLKGELAILQYIDSTNNPSVKDRLAMRSAKIIRNNIYRLAKTEEKPMIREECEVNPLLFLDCVVLKDFEYLSDELLSNARMTYLKVFSKSGCSESDFFIEVLDD